MRDKALYFPFIIPPPSRWTSIMLLYWDAFGSIVPLDHTFDGPNGEFMRDLVQKKLVVPIFPRQHLYQVPDYETAFLEYIAKKQVRIERQREALFVSREDRVPVHMEKLQGIGEELERRGLGFRAHGDWYELDAWVANHLMTFLASTLGRLESVAAAPVTDDPECFKLLGGNVAVSPASESRLSARVAILDKLLPVPVGPMNLDEFAAFKKSRGSQLRDFRREVESRCISVAQAAPEDRADALDLAVADLCKERDKIAEKMRDRWSDIVLNPLYSVVGAGMTMATKPFVDPTYGGLVIVAAGISLTNAVYRAYRSNQDYVAAINKPMAYAAAFNRKKPRRATTA